MQHTQRLRIGAWIDNLASAAAMLTSTPSRLAGRVFLFRRDVCHLLGIPTSTPPKSHAHACMQAGAQAPEHTQVSLDFSQYPLLQLYISGLHAC